MMNNLLPFAKDPGILGFPSLKLIFVPSFLVAVTVFGCGQSPNEFDPIKTESDSHNSTDVAGTDTPTEDSETTQTDLASDSDEATETDSGSEVTEDTDSITGSDTMFDTDTDTATDTEVDTDSFAETDPQPDSDTASESDFETDTETELDTGTGDVPTPCEQAVESDQAMECCPPNPPTACYNANWAFSEHDNAYGCCTQDLLQYVYCGGPWNLWIQKEECDSRCAVQKDNSDQPIGIGCVPIDGYDCQHPVNIDHYPQVWSGQWSDFGNTFSPGNDCGSAGDDIWLLIEVKAGESVTATEITGSEVVLRRVPSCQNSNCSGYADMEPETLVLKNSTGSDLNLFVVVGWAGGLDELSISFTN